MLELLLARMDADRKAIQEEMRSYQEEMQASCKEVLAKLEADRQANRKAWREEMAAMRD
jgi:hypothetical protein